MTILHACILAIIEGITEYLPVSSTGHMILMAYLLHIPQTEFTKSFEIIIQLGAILAVVVLYFRKIISKSYIWKKIMVAFLPAGIIGFGLYKLIKQYLLGNPLIVVISLFLGGVLLLIVEKYVKNKSHSIESLSYKDAGIIGLFQTLSIIPGVSRSAATIVGGLLVGLPKDNAVEFSFFLAIPTMVAASGLDLFKSSLHFTQSEIIILCIGFIIAFVTAVIAVKAFVTVVKKYSLRVFAYYRIVIALVYWLLVIPK